MKIKKIPLSYSAIKFLLSTTTKTIDNSQNKANDSSFLSYAMNFAVLLAISTSKAVKTVDSSMEYKSLIELQYISQIRK